MSRGPSPLGFSTCAAPCIPYTPLTGGGPETAGTACSLPLYPFSGACSSLDFALLQFASHSGEMQANAQATPFFSSFKQRNYVRPLLFGACGKACPGLGEAPGLVAESGHLPEAEVSFHFEMSLQVPRKEKENSCCCHHQLFPQIVQPAQLPLRTLLMKAGR